MRPRNFIFAVVILSVLCIHFSDNSAAIQSGRFGYCAGSSERSEVYFTEVFNTGLNPNYVSDTRPIQDEYNEYLKGRFDVKSNSSFSVSCHAFDTVAQTQSSKQNYEMQMRQGNKHIVEVEWNYRPDPSATPTMARPGHSIISVVAPQPDHAFCISDTYQNTVYVTGPVAAPPPVTMSSWINGFTDFLKGKYGFQGRVYCNMGTVERARRLTDAHSDGARAAGTKVVETGWKYDATQTTSSASRPVDEDREPAQRPAAQPANLQARDFANKETARATAYCVHDRVMAAAFDCDCLRRQIATYRKDHVSDTLSATPTPLEELFKGDKVDFKSCIQVDWKFKPGVRGVMHLPGSSEAVRDCVVEKFHTLLAAKPYPTQSQDLLNDAIKACR